MTKVCKECGVEKTLDCFTKAKKYSLGVKNKCKDCLREKRRKYDRDYYEKNSELIRDNRKKYRKNNLEKVREASRRCYKNYYTNNREKISAYHKNYGSIRRGREALLTNSLLCRDYEYILLPFNNKCALTDSNNISIDHFIPISWGHGGTYLGNVYPLEYSFNCSKNNKNPFEWAKEKSLLNTDRWNLLIDYLASLNGLSPTQFEDFVYWCENNKRTVEQIQADGDKTSLELYLEARELYSVC